MSRRCCGPLHCLALSMQVHCCGLMLLRHCCCSRTLSPMGLHSCCPCARLTPRCMPRCRRTIINAGYSPMSFFAKDYASYFKLAELLSLVDLSLVRVVGTWPDFQPRCCYSVATTAAAAAHCRRCSLTAQHAQCRVFACCDSWPPCSPRTPTDHQAGSAVQPVGR